MGNKRISKLLAPLLLVDTTDRDPGEVLDHVWAELGKLWPLPQDGPSDDGPSWGRSALAEL